MRKIKLTQGKFALIDEIDFELVSQFKWYYFKRKDRKNEYALTSIIKDGKRTTIRLHCLIMNSPKNILIDHKNGNGLDNRRENLRLASNQQNQQNSQISKANKTGFKGVSIHPSGKYQSSIRANNKDIYLGLFADPKEAAQVYDNAAKKYFGEFAKLNFQTKNP